TPRRGYVQETIKTPRRRLIPPLRSRGRRRRWRGFRAWRRRRAPRQRLASLAIARRRCRRGHLQLRRRAHLRYERTVQREGAVSIAIGEAHLTLDVLAIGVLDLHRRRTGGLSRHRLLAARSKVPRSRAHHAVKVGLRRRRELRGRDRRRRRFVV